MLFLAFFVCSMETGGTQVLEHVGRKPAAFSLVDTGGKTVSLEDFADKKATVLLFWSTWSRNSKKALTRLNNYYQSYKDRGIQVVGINADSQHISEQERDKIRTFMEESAIAFPVLLDNELQTFHAYGIIALPSTVVISGTEITYALPGLPLVGTEELFDHLLVLAGEEPQHKIPEKRAPLSEAVTSVNLARKLVQRNMNPMAYMMYQKAIKKDPQYIPPYVELAALYESEGKSAEAEAVLRQALSVEPDDPALMGELGFFLTKKDRLPEALGLLDKAVREEAYPPAQFYYAYALGRNGQMAESLAAFDRAAESNPFESSLYELRAEVYEANDMPKEAAADYRKALELVMKILR